MKFGRNKKTAIILAGFCLIASFVLTQKINAQGQEQTPNSQTPSAENRGEYETIYGPQEITDVNPPIENGCSFSLWGGENFMDCLKFIIATVGGVIVEILSYVLSVAGWLFDKSIDISIKTFAITFGLSSGGASGLSTAWAVMRDIANISFIFAMLYIAIGTMLQLQGIDWKKMVVGIITAAILVNFSMLIVNVMIDTSNIVSLYFYSKVTSAPGSQQISIRDKFTTSLHMEKDPAKPSGNGSLTSIIITIFASIIMIIVTTFVLLSGAILFIIRSIYLAILIVLSPLPFILMAIPSKRFSGRADEYWKNLSDHLFWPPIYMFCLYLSFTVMDSLKVLDNKQGLGEILNSAAGKNSGIIASAASTAVFYFIVIFLMLGSIILAKQFGAAGASFATKMAGGITMAGFGTPLALEKRYLGGRISGALEAAGERFETAKKTVATGIGVAQKAVPGAMRGVFGQIETTTGAKFVPPPKTKYEIQKEAREKAREETELKTSEIEKELLDEKTTKERRREIVEGLDIGMAKLIKGEAFLTAGAAESLDTETLKVITNNLNSGQRKEIKKRIVSDQNEPEKEGGKSKEKGGGENKPSGGGGPSSPLQEKPAEIKPQPTSSAITPQSGISQAKTKWEPEKEIERQREEEEKRKEAESKIKREKEKAIAEIERKAKEAVASEASNKLAGTTQPINPPRSPNNKPLI